jgi:hypothetical protein
VQACDEVMRDVAFLAGIQPDVVADANLPGQRDEQPGEEDGRRFLQGERNCKTSKARRRSGRPTFPAPR